MFGLDTLDTAIGLIFVYLLFGFVATGFRESVEAWLKARGEFLERGLLSLVSHTGDATNTTTGFAAGAHRLVERLYQHPRIFGLFRGTYVAADGDRTARRAVVGKLPSYIPASSFVDALLDHVGALAVAPNRAPLLDRWRLGAEALDNANVRNVVIGAIEGAGGDPVKVRAAIEQWYNAGMDRVSGWYRRRTHWILLGFSLFVAVGLNVNTIVILHALDQNAALRGAIASQAAQITAADTTDRGRLQTRVDAMRDVGMPIGWEAPTMASLTRVGAAAGGLGWLAVVAGWLMTAFAISLGGPFWFDLLNRFMVVRATVKPHEKSPEEGSKDSGGRKDDAAVTTTATTSATTSSSPPADVPHNEVDADDIDEIAALDPAARPRDDDGDDDMPVASIAVVP